jgi:hypothetical protein
MMTRTPPDSDTSTLTRAARYPLLDALIERRSRRFAKGLSLNGGPLAYASARPPQPLSLEEQAALAFAGCGITSTRISTTNFTAPKR